MPHDFSLPGPRDVSPYQWHQPLQQRAFVSALSDTTTYDREVANWVETPDLSARAVDASRPTLIWWTIDTFGFECWRTAGPPMAFNGPENSWRTGLNEFPAGGIWPARTNAGIRTCRFKLRIRYQSDTGLTRVVDTDVGQGRPISVLTTYVRVSLLVAHNTIEKKAGQTDAIVPGDGERIVDSILGGRVIGSYSSHGSPIATFSQIIDVAADTVRTHQIPAGAVAVRVYQTAAGTIAPLQWVQGVASDTANPSAAFLGPALGEITFRPGQRNTESMTVPGLATHIATTAPDVARRLFFVWEIAL